MAGLRSLGPVLPKHSPGHSVARNFASHGEIRRWQSGMVFHGYRYQDTVMNTNTMRCEGPTRAKRGNRIGPNIRNFEELLEMPFAESTNRSLLGVPNSHSFGGPKGKIQHCSVAETGCVTTLLGGMYLL